MEVNRCKELSTGKKSLVRSLASLVTSLTFYSLVDLILLWLFEVEIPLASARILRQCGNIYINREYFYTDSIIILVWIYSSSAKRKKKLL